ncbi:hypothetical protein M0R45_027946 [Rubus argutus]|uniref:Stalled ribosome sensor GCN1-like N-terminal domain-containing protein n=1 Tax=Rubus argutus TaxID=59490 RepID=A0AAW1W4E2_RUBAR
MLKRNPEIVLESVGILLKSVNLDLSKYAVEILSVVLPQARHADEGRRVGALEIVQCLSQSSSNPDALEAMFNAVKSVIGGSEGRLYIPYQRLGMINALQELCNAPDGKHLNRLSQTSCNYLRSCYNEDGNEDVKLAILSALGSWAARSADVVSIRLSVFFIFWSSALLDGIYALLLVGKIAAVDIKAEEIVVKEKIWFLISQNEPSLLPISLASKLLTEDCMACVNLLEVILVEHLQRALDSFSVRSLSQLIIFFMCHPCWDIRRVTYNATKKIIPAAPQLAEHLLIEFTTFISVVEEKHRISKSSETDSSLDSQVPFLPSVEVSVKALLVISSAALPAAPSASMRVLFCAHHPYLVGTAKRDAVWRRIHKCLHKCGFDINGNILADMENLCKGLLETMWLPSTTPSEQQAAISSLSTLMAIAPGETFVQFEKHLKHLPYRYSHDTLSENDIRIFHTPEGLLSSEQGVYIAESVAAKNTKQAKGRFRMYEDLNDMDNGGTNHSAKVEPSSKTGKSTKKPG